MIKVTFTDKPRCESFKNNTTEVCGNPEYIPGTRLCRQHGSTQSAVQAKAYRRGALTEVQRWSDSAGQSGNVELFQTNPFQLLQETITAVHEFQALIKAKIEVMGDGEDWRYVDKSGAEQLRSEISLYERALDRSVRAATAISKLNIEERYLAISEKQATSIIYILSTVLQRIPGITDSQRDEARRIVGEVIEEMLTQPSKKRYV